MEDKGTLKVAYYKLDIDTGTAGMEVIEIADTLEEMQRLVGGHIEVYPVCFEHNIILVCNEEGKLVDLPATALVVADKRLSPEVICGNFFVCRVSGENMVSIKEEDMDYIKELITLISYDCE